TAAHAREGTEPLGPLAGDAITAVYGFAPPLTGFFASHRARHGAGTRYGLHILGTHGQMTIYPDGTPVHLLEDPSWNPGRSGAARAGQDADTFIRNALEERVRRGESPSGASPLRLSAVEADLLQKINQGLPPEVWERYHELVGKRRAETLTPDEYTDLIGLSD